MCPLGEAPDEGPRKQQKFRPNTNKRTCTRAEGRLCLDGTVLRVQAHGGSHQGRSEDVVRALMGTRRAPDNKEADQCGSRAEMVRYFDRAMGTWLQCGHAHSTHAQLPVCGMQKVSVHVLSYGNASCAPQVRHGRRGVKLIRCGVISTALNFLNSG
uniref:Uncharacterized protein n=1 Tax=Eutreptiella gymnastica TaxID=73025 RepID=A0A7S4CLJ7_9EUGL